MGRQAQDAEAGEAGEVVEEEVLGAEVVEADLEAPRGQFYFFFTAIQSRLTTILLNVVSQ